MLRRVMLATGMVAIHAIASPGIARADDNLLTSGKKLHSQFNEELVIRHFFKDRKKGFFADVGAYHWRKYSTTYYLEKHLEW